jgi:hypothetical protein
LAVVVLAAGVLGVRYAIRRPYIEVTIPPEKWEIVTGGECGEWFAERRIYSPFFGRRDNGEYYMPFPNSRSAEAFRERWLK